jgi:hypothetical protein
MSTSLRRTLLRTLAVSTTALVMLTMLAAAPAFADRYDDRYDHRHGGYNDEYIFVATRTLNEADVHPVAKVPLFPVTFVLDLVALPVEVIAGLF